MTQNGNELQAVKLAGVDGLEPYLRLIELQKQMIELVRQHEKTKSECAALRAQLLEEMTRRRRPQWAWRGIGRPAGAGLKHLTALWKSRRENRPRPDAVFLSQNRLIKI